jgi:flavin-dependent dehydrogenase
MSTKANGNGQMTTADVEEVDVVTVGGRIAGGAAAIAFASRGRSVICLDRMKFPSNIVSTHGCLPAHVREFQLSGFLDRVLASEPPPLRYVLFADGHGELRMPAVPCEGVDFGICMARPELDTHIQDHAASLGAQIRDRCNVTEIVWENGRAVGVRYTDMATREKREIRAKLVIGADGYRGHFAHWVGKGVPYRQSDNARGNFYWYLKDPKEGTIWRNILSLWRAGRVQGLTVPMPRGMLSVQICLPVEDIPAARKDPLATWEQALSENRRLAERVAGAELVPDDLRREHLPENGWIAVTDQTSYFRESTGPGWAMAGDAGHFKDPLVGQGIRDGLRYGRFLGEMTADVLDDPTHLDATLGDWEARRNEECRITYHWGNLAGRNEPDVDPLFSGIIRALNDANPEKTLSGVFSRAYPYYDATPLPATLNAIRRALSRPGADRKRVLKAALNEMKIELDVRSETKVHRGRHISRVGRSEDARPGGLPLGTSSPSGQRAPSGAAAQREKVKVGA